MLQWYNQLSENINIVLLLRGVVYVLVSFLDFGVCCNSCLRNSQNGKSRLSFWLGTFQEQ